MANPKVFSKQIINTTSDQDALQIRNVEGTTLGWIDSTGTGQGNLASGGGGGTPGGVNTNIQFNSNGSFGGDANLAWDNTNKQLSIGGVSTTTSAALTIVGVGSGNAANPIETHSNFANGLSMYTHSNSSFRAANVQLLRSRGTQNTPTAVLLNDNLSYTTTYGYDGTDYFTGGAVNYFASENWNSTSHGTYIKVLVTPSGSIINGPALFIDNSTNVGFGGNTSPAFRIQTDAGNTGGSVALGAPASAPTDGNILNGQISFYLDEAGNNLKVRVKYSNGTLKTATIALT